MIFGPGAHGFAAIFCPGVGDFVLSKIPRGRPQGGGGIADALLLR